MSKEILINAGAGEIRVAVIEDGRLYELFLERTIGRDDGTARRRNGAQGGQSLIGNIVLGRVQRVLPGMQAAFVDIGLDRAGFLGAREARCLAELPGFELTASARAPAATCGPDTVGLNGDATIIEERTAPRIGDCVHEGEEIVVQVVKDPIGEKGARLSANVTLPGRLLVLVPNQQGVALSRRIDDEGERVRLAALCTQMVAEGQGRLAPGAGYIVRSAAIGAEFADLREDAERLGEAWLPVADKRKVARAPATLHQDLEPIARMMRDEVDAATTRVLIDDSEALAAARAYCRRAMPEAEATLELFEGPGALFDRVRSRGRDRAAFKPARAARLGRLDHHRGDGGADRDRRQFRELHRSGGARRNKPSRQSGSGRRDRPAIAPARHRRADRRSISSMSSEQANVEKVLDALHASLARDRTPAQISPMSEFGLVEITRKRMRDPLVRLVTEGCRVCRGRGRVRSCESVALEILRRVEREARQRPGAAVVVRASPEVIYWLESHGEELRACVRAAQCFPRLVFEPRPEFAREGFDVLAAAQA